MDPIRLEAMTTSEIHAALAAEIAGVTEDQIMAIREFIYRVGGIENAKMAVEMLREIDRAA